VLRDEDELDQAPLSDYDRLFSELFTRVRKVPIDDAASQTDKQRSTLGLHSSQTIFSEITSFVHT
jgi:hypothetical protein